MAGILMGHQLSFQKKKNPFCQGQDPIYRDLLVALELASGFRTRHVVLMINPLVLQQICIIIFIIFFRTLLIWLCRTMKEMTKKQLYSLNKRTNRVG